MMDKQGVYRFLREQGVEYECVEHPAACNREEMSQIPLPHPEADAKNLFVRDDRKRNYYLITVKGDKRLPVRDVRLENVTCVKVAKPNVVVNAENVVVVP